MPTSTTTAFPRAWACRIGRAQDAGIELQHTHSPTPTDAGAPAAAWPADLAVLKFLGGSDAAHTRRVDGRQWHWTRT